MRKLPFAYYNAALGKCLMKYAIWAHKCESVLKQISHDAHHPAPKTGRSMVLRKMIPAPPGLHYNAASHATTSARNALCLF